MAANRSGFFWEHSGFHLLLDQERQQLHRRDLEYNFSHPSCLTDNFEICRWNRRVPKDLANFSVSYRVGDTTGRSHWSETQWRGLQVPGHAQGVDGGRPKYVLHQGFFLCVHDARRV